MLSRPQTGWYPSSQTVIRTADPLPTRPTNANAARLPFPCSSVVAVPCFPRRCSTPLSFAAWSEFCPPETITLNSFPFTNASVDIPLWALANTTNTGSFDLAQAKRIAGVKEPFPTIWIVVISLAIAAIFFLLFLAVFCYIRRHRVQTWMQRRRGGGGGGRNSATYAQIERKSFDAAGNPKPKRTAARSSNAADTGWIWTARAVVGAASGTRTRSARACLRLRRRRFRSRTSAMRARRASTCSRTTRMRGTRLRLRMPAAVGVAGSGSGGGGAPGKYSDRARAQAADNAMKRSDRSG
ncbi:hypothetical protein BKA62DRAFT_714690, partial [Auriculariales sp. MPI-PUGE-AT-0066]